MMIMQGNLGITAHSYKGMTKRLNKRIADDNVMCSKTLVFGHRQSSLDICSKHSVLQNDACSAQLQRMQPLQRDSQHRAIQHLGRPIRRKRC
ncbi:hypothetical protein ASE57_06030 [Sphingomonas sp. Leaf11]|nr:hypothetical protein ASE58_06035 [Sphingomonas sp. Leaf9]KQM44235.1 hypothetical protein ASE57_06030 [Sphingomonas sp. Leaf11]